MHYPYDRYMKALLIKGYSAGVIHDRLVALKLNAPSEVELDRLRDSMVIKLPEEALTYTRPGAQYDFKKFVAVAGDAVKELDIDELIPVLSGTRNEDWDDALLILTDIDYRLMVMCMSIYGYSDDEILKLLAERYKINISKEALRLFYKYFWDLYGMSQLELYHYIGNCPMRKHRFLLMDSFHRKEKSIKWRMTGESILTAEDILTTVMNESFEKFRDSVQSEEVESVNRTEKWANLAIRAAEKLRDITSTNAPEVAAKLELSLSKITQKDIPTIDESPEDIL